MLGLRSPAIVVASLTMLGVCLFAVTTARAQTPVVPADRPVAEATVPIPESPAKTIASTITEPIEAKKAETTAAVKTDAAPSKTAVPATAPMQGP